VVHAVSLGETRAAAALIERCGSAARLRCC
jgi:3-deoxy-D-manno-octulosonic-acid transferase